MADLFTCITVPLLKFKFLAGGYMFISIHMYAMFTHAWLEYKYWMAKLVLHTLYRNNNIYVDKTFEIL